MSDESDKARVTFEAWITNRPWFAKAKMRLDKTSDGSYKDYRVNDRWAAFLEGSQLSGEVIENLKSERATAIYYAIYKAKLPNIEVESFANGWVARANRMQVDADSGHVEAWNRRVGETG